jgi:hypothetical protein
MVSIVSLACSDGPEMLRGFMSMARIAPAPTPAKKVFTDVSTAFDSVITETSAFCFPEGNLQHSQNTGNVCGIFGSVVFTACYGVLTAGCAGSFKVTCVGVGSCVESHPPPRDWIN